MTYYIFIKDEKINGSGEAIVLNENILSVIVSSEIYKDFLENPNKYSYSDGEIVLNPNYEEEQKRKEQERIAQLSLTKREVFLAIYQDKGITPEQIRSQITDQGALIEFDYAEKYYRGNPLIDLLGASLGYTKGQLDYLFEYKTFA